MLRWITVVCVVLGLPANAAAPDERAREIAECGYLAHIAVQQMRDKPDRPAVYDDVVRDVVDFTNLYYLISRTERPHDKNSITFDMLMKMATVGENVHSRRTLAMSPKNALRLSNRILDDCRTDLRLMGKKMVHE